MRLELSVPRAAGRHPVPFLNNHQSGRPLLEPFVVRAVGRGSGEARHHDFAPSQRNHQGHDRVQDLSLHSQEQVGQRPSGAHPYQRPYDEPAFHVQNQILEELATGKRRRSGGIVLVVVPTGFVRRRQRDDGTVRDADEAPEEAEDDDGHGGREEAPQQGEQHDVALALADDVLAPNRNDQEVRPERRELDEESHQQSQNQRAELEPTEVELCDLFVVVDDHFVVDVFVLAKERFRVAIVVVDAEYDGVAEDILVALVVAARSHDAG